MRYIGTCIGFLWFAVPITDTVKMSISMADISADPIIGTPLDSIETHSFVIVQYTKSLAKSLEQNYSYILANTNHVLNVIVSELGHAKNTSLSTHSGLRQLQNSSRFAE